MGQPDAKRLYFGAVQALSSALNDDRQTLSDTAFIEVGDVLEFWDQDASGCLSSLIGTRTVTGVCPDEAITLDSAIDLTVVTGSAVVRNRSIDDVQSAISRLFTNSSEAGDFKIEWAAPISASVIDSPVGGQSTQSVSDASCFAAGDSWAVISDEGLAGTGVVISIDTANDEVVLDSNIDVTSLTNPKLINTSVDLRTQLSRLKSLIDQIGAPECEDLPDGDCDNTVFYGSQSFTQNSSSVYLDGVRKRKGTSGTLASLVNGAANAQLTFTSLVLGLEGNNISIELVDPAAASQALSVSVSGTFDGQDRLVSVSLATDGGSLITSTAQDVADAINADADAKRLMRVIYGGDGTGVQSALVSTNLAGGLDDGTGDYVELQGISGNALGNFEIISFHIRPNESNRMDCPPSNTEELDLCYTLSI